jgi:phosphatidylinositol alpha-1,6-mannosyltransferase
MHSEIVGIFPSFALVGGVQASGREAWRGIANDRGSEKVFLFRYEPASGKLRAVLSAVRNHRQSDLVLIWHLNLLRLLPCLTVARRSVVFLHGIEAWRKVDRFTASVLRRTDLILSNSNYTWERFTAANPSFQRALHATVHLGAGEPVGNTLQGPSPTPIALMLGRMLRSEDYKGHRQLIEAWPNVVRRMPRAQLWIAGDGDLRPELEAMSARFNVAESVRFLGPVSDAEKENLICASRCLALPSRGEGFGLVYLEAMRAGRPCLISDQDAAREVVDAPSAGMAVNPADPHQIANAIIRMLTAGPEWDRWSVAARRRYESQFTATHFHRRLNMALLAA